MTTGAVVGNTTNQRTGDLFTADNARDTLPDGTVKGRGR
jgi:hypothetical protein